MHAGFSWIVSVVGHAFSVFSVPVLGVPFYAYGKRGYVYDQLGVG